MARFDLGETLTAVRDVPVGLPQAYRLSRKVLEGYEGLGYTVQFEDERPPETFQAGIHDAKGTRLSASVSITRAAEGSQVRLTLLGSVVVGGMQAMFATEPMVRKIAKQKLEELLYRTFYGVQAEPAPEPVEVEPEPAKPEPEPAEPAEPEPEPDLSEPAPTPDLSEPTPIDEGSDDPSLFPTGSLEHRLAIVKTLYARGLIDEFDYRTKKAALLSSL